MTAIAPRPSETMTTAASRSVQPLPVATSPATSQAAAQVAAQVEAFAATVTTTEPFEAQVIRWLQANPAFFDDQPELLADLSVRHPLGGKAVSLVERQMKILRERNIEMRHKLSHLMDVARDNDRRAERVKRLPLGLLEVWLRAERSKTERSRYLAAAMAVLCGLVVAATSALAWIAMWSPYL